MGKRDPRVDVYIKKSPDFAKPILTHIREVAHEACPDMDESIKWGAPFFEYKGVLAGMAAFKQHCGLNLWKGSLIVGDDGKRDSAGQFGALKTVSDLPSRKVLIGYFKQAAKLNEEGTKAPGRDTKVKKPAAKAPADLAAALKKNKKAQSVFDAFSQSRRRDYIEWITGAKTDATREKRLNTAMEWISEGKSRNWKYER
ncbi:MAG: YdeI/OmpD-associated family protein [Gemmatimonadales bacterium]